MEMTSRAASVNRESTSNFRSVFELGARSILETVEMMTCSVGRRRKVISSRLGQRKYDNHRGDHQGGGGFCEPDIDNRDFRGEKQRNKWGECRSGFMIHEGRQTWKQGCIEGAML